MSKVLVKGYEIEVKVTKSAYDRKVVLFANNIIEELGRLGIRRDDVEIKTNVLGNKNVPAVIEFWSSGYYLRFSYSLTKRFVDNMYVIMELIRCEVADVIGGKKAFDEFLKEFSENSDAKEIASELKDAKITLGLGESEDNLEIINNAYKKLAREHHPDAGGDVEEFQKINKAHKLIKKEMGI